MAKFLPLRANLEWLKKVCKERLVALRASSPTAKLGEVQLAVAREYGFASWRKLKAHVEEVRDKLRAIVPLDPAHAAQALTIEPSDVDLLRLLSAVRDGDKRTVTELLGTRHALAAAHGPDGQTALHVAAQCNDPELAVFLLAYGADPEARFGQSGHTALSWAVTCSSIEFAKTLVRLGNAPDLFCAAGIGSVDDVGELLDASGVPLPGAVRTGSSRYASDGSRLPCPPHGATEQISDALYIACRNGHADVVRFLLSKQPDLSFKAYLGATPLHWAHFGGSQAAIELLLRAGADASARDDAFGCTPRAFGICVPANWGLIHLVQRRLGEDPTLANSSDGETGPLHQAARAGNVEIVRVLLRAGANPARRDGSAQTPLDVALERGHVQVAELLRTGT